MKMMLKSMDENDYESAYHYYRNFAEMDIEMLEERLQQNVLEIQKKYDYEKIENEYNVKLLRKHRILMFSLLATLITGTLLFIQTKNTCGKERKN